MVRKLTRTQQVVDVAVAVVFVLFASVGQWNGGSVGGDIVVLIMGAALALRRRSPGIALGVAWVGAIVQMATHSAAPAFSDVAVFGVLYCTASYGGRVVRWLGLASAALGAALATAYIIVLPIVTVYGITTTIGDVVRSTIFLFFGLFALLGVSWTLGQLALTRRRARESRRAQFMAEQDVVVEQERNRIARDMHDVVAHSLAVVIAQADGARYTEDAQAMDTALTTISSTAREALGDVRLLLTQLRHSESEGPLPALGDLGRLVDQLRESGLDIRRTDSGVERPLPAGQQLALYRIVQEALTNALRHGDTVRPVELSLDWSDPVTVRVRNAFTGTVASPGHGLAGMRERALLAGGTLDAQRDGDDWVVTATLPA